MNLRLLWVLTGCMLLAACKPAAAPETVYANLAPEVQYTGMASCQPCHQEIYDSYQQTGMGKSLYRPDHSRAIEDFGPAAVVHDAFLNLSYHPYWQGADLYVQEYRVENGDTVHNRREKVDYIVGSGHQTRSYLLERNGYYYEVPITWYSLRKKWDLSPGYEDGKNSRFDREIGEECMACHTGKIEYSPGTLNHFRKVALGIDCEKCHGPGQEHITRMERDEIVDVGRDIDYSIVNPEKLPVRLQFDVCSQCHLQGTNVLTGTHASVQDYRPGMRLKDVYQVFVEEYDTREAFGIASHAERLMQSACFLRSGEKMSCTTCHDPHVSVKQTQGDVFSAQCQNCHSGGADKPVCSAPAAMQATQNGQCYTCHMPRGGTSDIPHVTFTDHRIRVVRDTAPVQAVRQFLRIVCATDSAPDADLRARAALLYFERTRPDPALLTGLEKDLAPGSHLERARLHYFRQEYAPALTAVEQALAERPEDTWRLALKAQILEAMGRFAEAQGLYASIYRKNDLLTEARLREGILILKTAENPQQALQAARAAFEEVLAKRPGHVAALANLGFVELNSGAYGKAIQHLREALRQDPDHLQSLENLLLTLTQSGQPAEARMILNRILRLQPDYPKQQMMQARIDAAAQTGIF